MINKDVRAQVDSLARLAIEEQTERLLNTLEEQETTLILFDTDKPPTDSTGLPPVKAIARQEVKREEKRQEKQLEAFLRMRKKRHGNQNNDR